MSKKFEAAGHGRRIAAFVIDNSICAVAGQWIVKKYLLVTLPDDIKYLVALLFIFIVIPILYWVLLPMFFKATPAKRWLGLRVVRATDAGAPTFGALMLREVLARFISGFAFGLGYLWALFNQERRAWHDLLAGTRVVRIK